MHRVFVKVSLSGELLVSEAAGNDWFDTLQNVFATRKRELIFFIPGFTEALRVNGSASLSFEAADLEAFSDEKRAPKAVINIAGPRARAAQAMHASPGLGGPQQK